MQPIIFDMDGVLVDSEPLHQQHLEALFVKIGITEPEKLNHNFKGVNTRDTSIILIETFNLDYDVDELVKLSRKAYLEHLSSIKELPSIPGAIELVKFLAKASHPLALASSASAKRIELFLTKLGLKQQFKVIASGDDVEHSKPAPDIFLLAAKKLGVKPSDCIVIEDAENGVRAAHSAGMKCIAYGGSDHNDDNLLAADLVVKDFHALVRALESGGLPV